MILYERRQHRRFSHKQTKDGAFLSLILHCLIMLLLSCILMGSDAASGIGPLDTTVAFAGDDLIETLVLTPDHSEVSETEEDVPEDESEFEPNETTSELDESSSELDEAIDTPSRTATTNGSSEKESDGEAGMSAEEIHARRAAAGGDTGALLATLIWNNVSDLDIWVETPNGEKIYYKRKRGQLGMLDVDANSARSGPGRDLTLTAQPVENYVQQAAENGLYRVTVNLFQNRSSAAIPYTLGVWIEGQETLIRGIVSDDHPREIYCFEIQTDGLVQWIDASQYQQRLFVGNEAGVKLFALARAEFRRGQMLKSRELLNKLLAKTPAACPVTRNARLMLSEVNDALARRRARLR